MEASPLEPGRARPPTLPSPATPPAEEEVPEAEIAARFVYATLIVKPFRVEPVLRALETFRLRSLTTTEVRGYGRQKGHLELYQGREYAISFIPKIKVEVVLPQSEVEAMVHAVSHAARTGRIGDGKIFLQQGELVELELH